MLTFDKNDLAALHDRLGEISEKAGKNAVRKAARKAMVPVRDQVIANAPEDKTDPDNIRIKDNVALLTKWTGNDFRARVGIKGGARRNDTSPFYFRYVELGTKNIPARPFMAPALESQAQQVLDTLTEELRKAIFK